MSWDVVGIGENSIDDVYRVPEHPRTAGSGAKMPILSHTVSPGGQVATAMCTCSAMGLRTTYVGAFGSDDNGARIRQALSACGVDLGSAVSRDVPNRYAVILVDDRTGERIVLWHRDPALAITPDELPRQLIESARALHVDDSDERISIVAARVARAANVPVTSDIDRCSPQTEALVDAVTFPIFSEAALLELTGESDPEQALRRVRRRHEGWLTVTCGSRGAMILEKDRLHYSAAPRVNAVDTTGAGDVFRGAFIVSLLRGETPTDVLRFANAAAAASCCRHGAIGGVPTPGDVERVLTS